MSRILLSINPEHVEKIIDGSKEYEYRKIRCKREVDGILIYETFPVCRIVAEAEIEKIIEDTPKSIWNKTKAKSGISSEFFFSYYRDREKAIAYKLTNLKKYSTPKKLEEIGVKSAPQSFVYVD